MAAEEQEVLWYSGIKPCDTVSSYDLNEKKRELKDYQQWSNGQLRIQLIGAWGVAAKDRGGTSDPYAVLYFIDADGNELKDPPRMKTSVHKKTRFPKWENAIFEFKTSSSTPHRKLVVDMYDKNKIHKDAVLGGVVLDLDSLWDLAKRSDHSEKRAIKLGKNYAGQGKYINISGEANFELFYQSRELDNIRKEIENLQQDFEERDWKNHEALKKHAEKDTARFKALCSAIKQNPTFASIEIMALYSITFSRLFRPQKEMPVADAFRSKFKEEVEEAVNACPEPEVVRARIERFRQPNLYQWVTLARFCEAGGDVTALARTSVLMIEAVQEAGLYDDKKQKNFQTVVDHLLRKRGEFEDSQAKMEPGTDSLLRACVEGKKGLQFLFTQALQAAIGKGISQPIKLEKQTGHSLAHIAVLWCKDHELAHQLTQLTPPALYLDGVNEMSGCHEGPYKELLRVANLNYRGNDVLLGRYKTTREHLIRFYVALLDDDVGEMRRILDGEEGRYKHWATSLFPRGKLKHPDNETMYELEGEKPPLLVAIYHGSKGVCDVLRNSYNAMIDQTGKDGITAVTTAVLSDNIKILEWVLEQNPPLGLFSVSGGVSGEWKMTAVEAAEIVKKVNETGVRPIEAKVVKGTYNNGSELSELLHEYLKQMGWSKYFS